MRLFHVAAQEHVVSAARIDEEEEPENEAEAIVAEERATATPPAGSTDDAIQLDDGTGPETLPERIEEEDSGSDEE